MKNSNLTSAFCLAAATAIIAPALQAEPSGELGCIQLDTDHPALVRDPTDAFVAFCDIRPNQETVQCYILTPEDEWDKGEIFAAEMVLDTQTGGTGTCPAGTDDGKIPTIRG